MFFPLTDWVRVGNAACAASRKRRMAEPLAAVTEEEALGITGPELAANFVPDPAGQAAYAKLVRFADSVDPRIFSSDDLRSNCHEIFQPNNARALKAAADQSAAIQPLIEEFQEISASTSWQFPLDIEAEAEFPELTKLKRASFAFQLHGAYLWLHGDESSALGAFRAGLSVGHILQNCGGLFIHDLIGAGCRARLARLIRTGLAAQRSSDEFLANLDDLLTSTENVKDRLSALMDREFRLGVVPSTRLRSEPWRPIKLDNATSQLAYRSLAQRLLVEWTCLSNPNPFDRRATLRDIGRYYQKVRPLIDEGWKCIETMDALADELGRDIPKPYKEQFIDPIFGVPPTVVAHAWFAFRRMSNPYGKLSLANLLSGAANVYSACYRSEADVLAAKIAIAAARHRLAGHRGKIEWLEELVAAGFLESVPNDPVDGEPFRFDTASQRMWLPGRKKMTFEQTAAASKDTSAWIWALPTAAP